MALKYRWRIVSLATNLHSDPSPFITVSTERTIIKESNEWFDTYEKCEQDGKLAYEKFYRDNNDMPDMWGLELSIISRDIDTCI